MNVTKYLASPKEQHKKKTQINVTRALATLPACTSCGNAPCDGGDARTRNIEAATATPPTTPPTTPTTTLLFVSDGQSDDDTAPALPAAAVMVMVVSVFVLVLVVAMRRPSVKRNEK
jgi:hypothetical protein